ncbi:TonB-dependent receptor [Microbulbifer taiwanensis]|uniref:TonB-dependent receptor n=1 Tax=Microbulbifer taiwanensis TaxID=986746 RepID=A0ABW1YKE0_9GAMM|nr:TonB-dependent receptor [Microbulbifer taiwanensis]
MGGKQLKVAGGLNRQDGVQRTHSAGPLIDQEAYATLSLFAGYRVNEQLSFSVNGKNFTD